MMTLMLLVVWLCCVGVSKCGIGGVVYVVVVGVRGYDDGGGMGGVDVVGCGSDGVDVCGVGDVNGGVGVVGIVCCVILTMSMLSFTLVLLCLW